mmetsp:Transcript_31383/g.86275  ORF Transcript_31383/g.86275 Transcript_31383/m.86275 type:complete len:255 (-) Transcript_31383:3-767(-)
MVTASRIGDREGGCSRACISSPAAAQRADGIGRVACGSALSASVGSHAGGDSAASTATGIDNSASQISDVVAEMRADSATTVGHVVEAGAAEEMPPEKVPLSYGEKLVLQTYLKGRSRPYSQERQNELAKPRCRTVFSPHRGGISPRGETRKLDAAAASSLCSRLAQPRRVNPGVQRSAGEAMVLQTDVASRERSRQVDTHEMSTRLSHPKAVRHAPAPGELVLRCHNENFLGRRVDGERIAYLAKAVRRAGFH